MFNARENYCLTVEYDTTVEVQRTFDTTSELFTLSDIALNHVVTNQDLALSMCIRIIVNDLLSNECHF